MAPATPIHGSFVVIGNILKRALRHEYTVCTASDNACLLHFSNDCCDPIETSLLFTRLAAEHGAAGSNEIGAPCAA